MGIIIDLTIILVILIYIYIGYKKGLTGSIIKLFSFIIALTLAFILYKPVAGIVINKTQLDEKVRETITKAVIKEDEEENKEKLIESKQQDSKITSNLDKKIEKTTKEAKLEIIEKTTNTIVYVLIGIIVFVIARLILLIVSLFIKGITKLPLIKQIDEFGGIAYGFLEGIIIVYSILAIISLVSVVCKDFSIINHINKSTLGSILYNNNIILKIFFK